MGWDDLARDMGCGHNAFSVERKLSLIDFLSIPFFFLLYNPIIEHHSCLLVHSVRNHGLLSLALARAKQQRKTLKR